MFTEAIEKLQMVGDLPEGMIDQSVGMYEGNSPCCVGAHLAHFLGVDGVTEDSDYIEGAVAWSELFGGNMAHAIVLLRQAGAVRWRDTNPFGEHKWRLSVTDVCANLKLIEEMPSLRGEYFSYMTFDGHDFSDTDFEGAKFDECGLYATNFSNCNLRECNFSGASAISANFTHADLCQADLTKGGFNRAIFNHATMIGTFAQQTYFMEASFDHTDMTRRIKDEADFLGADLSSVIWTDKESVE